MNINIKTNKKLAFTLLEILFISILLSSGLLFVAKSIQHAKEVNYKVMQSVIANQIATEWVEIMYQLRNTNFLKYEASWYNYKEIINSCRLAHDFAECYEILWNRNILSFNVSDYKIGRENENLLLQTGYYYITNNWWKNEIHNCNDNELEGHENCSKIGQNLYAICQKSGSWIPCTWWHIEWEDESEYWHFYRYIEWLGNYNMDSNETGWTITDPEYFAADIDAQEYRFCSRVYRWWMQWWEIEICSTMTNFTD